MQLILAFLVITISTLFSVELEATELLSAREIMDKVDLQQREAADKSLSKSRLSSCPYVIENKKVVCTQTPRVRVMESVSRQLGKAKKDSRAISIILEPASERGVGMLTYSYDDALKDTESWLYLSALGKVKRMASGTGEDQEPVSLFGSEFTTEDMESGKTDEYDYKILQEGAYSGTEVWVIEATPKLIRLKKTNYSRLLVWIDKERLIVLKVQAYDKRGSLHKRTVFKQFEKYNDVWVARDLTVYNVKIKRLSRMKTEQLAMNVEVEDVFLTKRSLTDFAYREKILEALRAQF
ncbi:MAG: outer membrane lipoprotein-sorting protein [Oleiphilaceae bacterium]|jgi:outer membrane lipoprotein-sorting protein